MIKNNQRNFKYVFKYNQKTFIYVQKWSNYFKYIKKTLKEV